MTLGRCRRLIAFDVSDQDLAKRRAAWKQPPYKATSGTLWKYIKNVSPASEGCVTDGSADCNAGRWLTDEE